MVRPTTGRWSGTLFTPRTGGLGSIGTGCVAQLADDHEGGFIVARGTPKRQGQDERIYSVLLPESELRILVLRRLIEKMMSAAKGCGPAIIGFLTNTRGQLAVEG